MKLLKRILCVTLAFVITLGMLPWMEKPAEAATSLYWPVPGHTTIHPRGFHDSRAIDISDSSINGATVIAAIGGNVDRVFYCTKTHYGDISCSACYGYGTAVSIKGTDGRIYMYAHLQAGSIPSNIYSGASVSACQTLGKVGNTGNSSGAHLHFGISINTIFDKSGNINPANETYIYSSAPVDTPTLEIDSRYPTSFVANTLLWWNTSDGKTPVYSSINGSQSGYIYNGYNNEDDNCTIEEVYTNGWCKVTVPGIDGPRYCQLSVFINVISGYNPWWVVSPSHVDAYRRWDHGSPRGYLDAGDNVCIVSETEGMYQVIFGSMSIVGVEHKKNNHWIVSEFSLRHDFYVLQKRIRFLKLEKLRIP